MRKLLCFTCFLASLFLFGCATNMEPPIDHPTYYPKSWKQRKINVSDHTNWKISGAVSVQSRGKVQMGSFTWEQIDQRYAINIYGPLNLGCIGITGIPGKVTLVKPTGNYSAPTAESLMQQQLGWYLPVSNMYYWVRGLPAPGYSGKKQHDEYGHLIFLQQQGWRIQFQAFAPKGDADLPCKITMENQQLRVKLVIKNWELS